MNGNFKRGRAFAAPIPFRASLGNELMFTKSKIVAGEKSSFSFAHRAKVDVFSNLVFVLVVFPAIDHSIATEPVPVPSTITSTLYEGLVVTKTIFSVRGDNFTSEVALTRSKATTRPENLDRNKRSRSTSSCTGAKGLSWEWHDRNGSLRKEKRLW